MSNHQGNEADFLAAINKLSNLVRSNNCTQPNRALDEVLKVLSSDSKNVDVIQIAACKALMEISSKKEKVANFFQQKNDIVQLVLDVMKRNLSNNSILDECCPILGELSVPEDIVRFSEIEI